MRRVPVSGVIENVVLKRENEDEAVVKRFSGSVKQLENLLSSQLLLQRLLHLSAVLRC